MLILHTDIQVYTRAYTQTRCHAHTQEWYRSKRGEKMRITKIKLDIFLPRR